MAFAYEDYQYFKVETKDLIVVHDDIDLPNGHVRMRLKGGAGGHNGIKVSSLKPVETTLVS